MVYPATVTKTAEGYEVTFRDLDNVFTYGETEEEAIFNAQEALDGVLEEMAAQDLEIPAPSAAHKGEVLVPVSPDVAGPVLLHQLRRSRNLTLSEVAQRLGVQYQSYQRMEKQGANITLKSLKRAAAAMGATVEVRFHPHGE